MNLTLLIDTIVPTGTETFGKGKKQITFETFTADIATDNGVLKGVTLNKLVAPRSVNYYALGFKGRFRTGAKIWDASVAFKPDGELTLVDYGNDYQPNKIKAGIWYAPDAN